MHITYSLRDKKTGSALAFSLLYIALLLVLIIGISALITRIFKVNGYITQSIQAGYSSESAFELALYDLKMHREGYENLQLFQGGQIDHPASSSLGYKIEYRNTQDPDNKITVPLSNNKRQFALFFEDKDGVKDLENFSLNYWVDGPPSTAYKPSMRPDECMELRVSGKKGNEYETVTAHVACPESAVSLSDTDFYQRTTEAPSTQTKISLRNFLSTHKENYMVVNLISPALSNNTSEIVNLHLSTDKTIASFNKTITTLGRYNNLEIKRKVTFSQDQTPDLLSIAIYQ